MFASIRFNLGSGTQINGITTNSTSVTTVVDTNYEFYVRQNCGTDGESIWRGPFAFFTGYCRPTTTSTSYRIVSFSTTSIINGTTTQHYSSTSWEGPYINLSATETITSAAGLGVTFTEVYTGGNHHISIWVDWDNDGVFDNSEEVFYSWGSGNNWAADQSFSIPLSTLTGSYRMRVRSQYMASNPGASGSLALTPCGNLDYGTTLDFTLAVLPPCPPVTALNVSNVTQNIVDLTWTAGGTETLWNIEYGDQGFSQGSGTIVNGVTNPYTIIGLTAGTSYDVYVQANCGNGDESTWEMTSFTTAGATSTCPSPLNAGIVTLTPDSGSAASTFDVTATGYDIGTDITYTWEKSEDSGATWIPVGTPNVVNYSDLIGEVAPASGVVEYRLTVSCDGNTQSANATFTVTASRSDFDLYQFSYYPNPVNDILTFSSNQPIEKVTISNMLGQTMNINLSSDKSSLDMSNLASGNYLVKVTIEGVSKTIKIVKR